MFKSRLKKNRGFTLIELMITISIMGIFSLGVMNLFRDGLVMWNLGSARIALAAESKISMLLITKFIHNCQGASLRTSRFNDSQPANSYISADLLETIFVTTTESNCGCGTGSDTLTVGQPNTPVQIFQKGKYLLAVSPYLLEGTDLRDADEVKANTRYQTVTLTANLESIMFNFEDSEDSKTLIVGARFSKKPLANREPVTVFLKKTIAVKHFHSAGYYYNF
ncbi:MAG: PilW family protein [Candidatus Goldiibacteriota bacterium]